MSDKATGGSLGTGKGGETGAGKGTGRGTSASGSAGSRHGGEDTDKTGGAVSGLQESSGEFRIGESIVFGMRNGNILLRHSPQGDEVEVGEATFAGAMVDLFFTDEFKDRYLPAKKQG